MFGLGQCFESSSSYHSFDQMPTHVAVTGFAGQILLFFFYIIALCHGNTKMCHNKTEPLYRHAPLKAPRTKTALQLVNVRKGLRTDESTHWHEAVPPMLIRCRWSECRSSCLVYSDGWCRLKLIKLFYSTRATDTPQNCACLWPPGSTDQLELPRFSRRPASRIDRIKAGAGLDQKPDAVPRAASNRRKQTTKLAQWPHRYWN